MIGTSDTFRISLTVFSTSFNVVPPASARSEASWIAGPSAMGSEKGTPNSIISAPLSSSLRTISSLKSRDGSPAVIYVTKAILPFSLSSSNLLFILFICFVSFLFTSYKGRLKLHQTSELLFLALIMDRYLCVKLLNHPTPLIDASLKI